MSININNKFFITIIFIALISLMPCFKLSSFSCFATETYYDFSDEAQTLFDMQQNPANQIYNIIDTTYVPESSPKSNTFEQNTTQNLPAPTQNPSQNKLLTGNVVYIPVGSSFQAVLQSSISSESLMKYDTIAAVIDADWYQDNVLIAPQGSVVYGKAIDTQKAGRAYENGSLSITFDEILTPKGDYINLVSNTVVVSVDGKNRPLKITADVARGTLGGLATGSTSAGLAVMAAVGAIDGLLTAFSRQGEEVEIPAGTGITVRLIQAMNIAPYK